MRGNSLRLLLKDVSMPTQSLQGGPFWYIFQVAAPYFLTAMATPGPVLLTLSTEVEVERCRMEAVNEGATLMEAAFPVQLKPAAASAAAARCPGGARNGPTTDILYTWLGRPLLEE